MPSAATSSRSRRDPKRAPLNPFLARTVRSFRPTLVSLFVFGFFASLLTLAVPLYLLQIYSKVLPSGNTDTLIFLTAMALAAVIALGALEAIRRSVLSKAGTRFSSLVSEHLLDSAITRAVSRSRVSVNVMRDLANVRGFISGSSVLPLLDLPWTPLFILVLFMLHPLLGMIGLCGALVLVALALLNERLTRGPERSAHGRSRELLDDARGYVHNADVVRAMGMRERLLARWRERNAASLVESHHARRLNTRLSSLSKTVRLFLQIGIICAAAWLIVHGQLTPGATIASVLLLRRAISPLELSIRSWKSVLSARDAFHAINEHLDDASTLDAPRPMPAPSAPLRARRISMRVGEPRRTLFSRVSLELPAGTVSALVGPTASGKSTLLRVLAGLVAPRSGTVTLGGYDIAQWTPEQLGAHIGYLPQEVGLFAGTVRENIARLADAPIERVIAAAELAGAHELIQRLPAGYDTPVAEEGANLSGGQRQRIGLARAVYGEPVLVLLDEPDASLDTDGRSALRGALRRLRRAGVAVLVSTHHRSIEKLADRVYRLEAGALVAERLEREQDTTAAIADTRSDMTSDTAGDTAAGGAAGGAAEDGDADASADETAVGKPITAPLDLAVGTIAAPSPTLRSAAIVTLPPPSSTPPSARVADGSTPQSSTPPSTRVADGSPPPLAGTTAAPPPPAPTARAPRVRSPSARAQGDDPTLRDNRRRLDRKLRRHASSRVAIRAPDADG